jgi:hypothetical protein
MVRYISGVGVVDLPDANFTKRLKRTRVSCQSTATEEEKGNLDVGACEEGQHPVAKERLEELRV